MTPAILVVEGELSVRRVLRTALSGEGYCVWEASTKREGIAAFVKRSPQAVLLALSLPDGDGMELLAAVRERSEVPVLVTSTRTEERFQVRALDGGANDFVTKPFREAELLARLRAALRSASAHAAPYEERLEVGPLRLQPAARRVHVHGHDVALTPTEFSLLLELAQQAGKVLTHRQLLRAVWGSACQNDTQYLRVFVRQLRLKLEADPAEPRLLLTTPGIGYRLKAS